MQQDNMPQVAKYWNDTAHDFDAIYSGEKSPMGRLLDQWLRKDIYERLNWVIEKAGDVRGKTICDIGCGSGRFVSALARAGAARVTGVDVAPEMLKLARELVSREGVENRCNFVLADALDWRTDEQFDLTIAIGFWDYIADPQSRLRLIRERTLGRFLSAWPRLWTWRMPIRRVRLGALGCPVYFYKRQDVYRQLQNAGFVVSGCEVVGKLYCVEGYPAH